MPGYSSVTSSVVSAAGLARMQFAKNDASGIPQGTSGAIANGQDAGFGILIAAKKASNQPPQPRIIPVSGDNGRFLHNYSFRPASISEIDLSFGVFSDTAYAVFSGTKVDTTQGEWEMIGAETDTPINAAYVHLIENIDAQDANTGTDGQPRFINWIYPNVTMFSLFASHDEAAAAEWGYKGIPTRVGKYSWGTPFTSAVNGFTKAIKYKINSVYPITMHTFVGDGAKTTVILNYSPTSDTTGFGIKAYNASTGANVPITSVNIATRTVTFTSAPTAGTIVLIVYEAFDLLLS